MGIVDPATLAAATAATAAAIETGDELRWAIVRAISFGGREWTLEHTTGGVSSPPVVTTLPDPVTLDVMRASKLGLGASLSATLVPGASYLGFGAAGQGIAAEDVITSVADPKQRFRVVAIDDREEDAGRIMLFLARVR